MARHPIDNRKEPLDAATLARFAEAKAQEEGLPTPQTEALRKQPRLATPSRPARYAMINRGGDS